MNIKAYKYKEISLSWAILILLSVFRADTQTALFATHIYKQSECAKSVVVGNVGLSHLGALVNGISNLMPDKAFIKALLDFGA